MPDDSKKVDAYIAKQPDFARPILEKIRKAIHKGCPEVEEAIKWGIPYFMHNGMLGGMAAFKKHVGFGFWKSKEMDDPSGLFETGTGKKASMCNAHFHSAKEVPTQKILVDYVKRAVKLNESLNDSNRPKKKAVKKKISTKVPADLSALLKKNKKASSFFDSLPPGGRRDYIVWITEAKREATRANRLETTILWLSEGKRRHWKYESKKA